jgi:polyhydroxyalkanoate synthesis regulator phasin
MKKLLVKNFLFLFAAVLFVGCTANKQGVGTGAGLLVGGLLGSQFGKGSGKRAYKKWGKGIKPPSDQSRIIIVEDNLDELTAFNLEIELIAQYGRKDLGTGILHNRTNGGDGSAGHKVKGWKWSQDSKAKRCGTGNPAYGKSSSERQKLIASLTHKGKITSNETKEKRSKALKGREITWGNKISQKLRGKKQDPNVVAKRAESCRKTWAAKKALNT